MCVCMHECAYICACLLPSVMKHCRAHVPESDFFWGEGGHNFESCLMVCVFFPSPKPFFIFFFFSESLKCSSIRLFVQNPEWRKMFGADESDQASLDSPVKGRQSSERVGDATELKKPAVPPPSQQPMMLGDSGGAGGGGGGGGHSLSPQQPLSMEAVPLPINKPTKAGVLTDGTGLFASCCM